MTFQEFNELLRRCCFVNNEDIEVEVIDQYYWRINYYPDDPDGKAWYLSDYDALPVLSKVVGMNLSNTHVSRDGIWLEGEEAIPPKTRRSKR